MKRFWKAVSVEDGEILLDGKPVRTPGRVPLKLPTAALAEAVAVEWRGVGDTLDPRAMPLTGLANAAIDRIAPDPAAFAAGLAAYGESDLLYYRAAEPEPPVERNNVVPEVATPRLRYSTEFCTASTSTCITMPSPKPKMKKYRLISQVAVCSSSR